MKTLIISPLCPSRVSSKTIGRSLLGSCTLKDGAGASKGFRANASREQGPCSASLIALAEEQEIRILVT